MAQAKLTIDLDALRSNWRALDARSEGETAAVVKADGYGLGAPRVARALARAGARRFFVALAEEGAALREALGPGPEICVFSGHMPGDTDMINDLSLVPMINNIDQMLRHVEALPGAPFGIQLDTGMNRLGMEPAEWAALRDIALAQNPVLVMSHLACADDAAHPMNARQLQAFREMTDGIDVPRSLAATGGIHLGPDYHFDLTRPGVGLYGGLPFVDATPVVTLEVPVIQVRELEPGETVGYGNSFTASRPSRIATISAGYGDGILRGMGPRASLMAGETRCPVAGRISMDLIGVDVTDAPELPDRLELLGQHQSIDTLAGWADTIGYEILTSLGARLSRVYRGE
ncbi:MAG: alanine racemase [Marinovum algicola]|uniref:Alanine racemase n=1 Tax=Marinovum algicola TaxID=42444 RepID=A0A975WBL9_9RHOB|nr:MULTISPECIES: alanine racemase [Marinovum]AKO97475.1 alanine racemase [Marinovum algicola DG 898]MDD9738564.1 alanine racemase [Marinovum sp. SP66]SEJ78480.1 alanine racemase [Marinovum algicola]SLN59396.1 Alanine racemase, biosynthetic [Marinovum algicola]